MASAHQAGQSLRELDRERYLTTLYAPADKRAALTALYLFNAEIAAIRDKVKEPMAGEIRLQWWRDALAAGAETGNPLADDLIAAIKAHHLPIAAFDRMLEARIFDLYDDPMPDRATLEGYCGETASTLVQLAAMTLEAEAAQNWADAAGHAGCAMAMTGLLRLLPIHRARGQCYVPAEVLASAGTTRDAFVAGDNTEAAGRAVTGMGALAREHFNKFTSHAKNLPPELRPAFLPTAPVPAHLKAILAHPASALDAPRGSSGMRAQFAIMHRAAFGWR
ncbi:MAG: phytoene/squalene synthase family protein [Rhizobiaceae bacterium]